MYSQWSWNREVVTADLTDVRPAAGEKSPASTPTDHWSAVRVAPNGTAVGYAVKSAEHVWRPRALFNGRIAFMTDSPGHPGTLRLAQADWGYIRSAPSSLAVGSSFPDQGSADLFFGPDRDADGKALTAGCPAPCPGDGVLFAAGPVEGRPETFGLYHVNENWSGTPPAPRLLFDDPDFVDAEPVAVYPRVVVHLPTRKPPLASGYPHPATVRLADGRDHSGPIGFLENLAVRDAIRNPIPWQRRGQRGDPRRNPLIPPPTNLTSIAIYAAHRDRFDDPEIPRIIGRWEKLLVTPVGDDNTMSAWIPSNPLMPTVLAGLDAQGKVVKWSGTVPDRSGRPAVYLAYAGDHYSGTRPDGYHYCNGCHTGHTYTSLDTCEKVR
jgi:hypothetical protein